ncbi:MAG: hypothetical protein K2X77_06255 [Candidatus Obscuribacterales bacterium]|nr:hypothetical protein [Candidatus Obscuribacterales bacterium]
MTNQNKSSWLKKAGIAACGAALLLLFLVVFLPAMLPWPRAFDSNEWKSCTDHSIRYAMHKDFLSRHSVIGMTEASLIALLGKPDGRKPDEELSWDMGQAGGMDDNAIDFRLKEGKVVSFEVWGH